MCQKETKEWISLKAIDLNIIGMQNVNRISPLPFSSH